jgi:hypothetical protein
MSVAAPATAAAARPAPAPRYLISDLIKFDDVTVVNTATGRVTAQIKLPMAGGYWYSVAASGPLTFLAGENIDGGRCPGLVDNTYIYRIQLTTRGAVKSMHRILKPLAGDLIGANATPGGAYVGYGLFPDLTNCNSGPSTQLVIRNTVTGRVRARWTLGKFESVGSIALNAAGTTMMAATYQYSPSIGRPVTLAQSTRILRVAASGRPVNSQPKASAQAGPVAVSPDGTILYQIVQTSPLTPKSWLDPHPLAFALEAVSLRTGKTIAIYHRWTSIWRLFTPVLALDPSGQYLIVVNHRSVGRVDVKTGKYTQLPDLTDGINPGAMLPQGQGSFEFVAW